MEIKFWRIFRRKPKYRGCVTLYCPPYTDGERWFYPDIKIKLPVLEGK